MDDKIKLTHICTSCDKYEECVVERFLEGGGVDKLIECVHRDACVRAYKLGVQDGR